MVALGSVHQARKAYTHVSMFPVIDPGHLKEALAGYGKAMTHLRKRIVKEMLSSQQQAQIEPFLIAVFAIFSGFEDINFAEFQTQTTNAANDENVMDVAYSIPTLFNDFSEANKYLKRLEKARGKLREELLSVADEALKTLEDLPTDPAVMLCLKHCLSRSVDLSGREEILKELEALHYGYDAWISASRNSSTDLGAAPHSWAVIRMQCLISRFNARIMREPSEMISDLYEDDFVEVLDLAEHCLLVYPSTDEFYDSVSGVLSNSGYGLALSTEMIPQVALCGFKSRCTATRERAVDLLFVANKHDGVYQSAIFARFVRRPVEWEQRKAMELGAIPGPEGFEPSQIPEEARIVDSVFAQVKYRPRCINMINCRYACNEAGESRLEITEEICDLFTGAEFSSTTYDIATPQSCQQGIPQSSAGLVKSASSPGRLSCLSFDASDHSTSKCVNAILHAHSGHAKEGTSTSTPVSISSSATSAPVNVHPAFSMIEDSEYSPWRSYPSTLTRSSYSRYPKLGEQSTRTMRVPAGTLPE
ncbi:hypothetical protein PRZ48_009475 [Zasmidium cellare]|uniref:Uncharacterized protein n=1 Tax=Zasmidium cellare TaxID=395010 RepID=A0ABR0EBU4_ZASCE|nr:hypothetical protein PRZ48_009475 [Zasmidium cellare]